MMTWLKNWLSGNTKAPRSPARQRRSSLLTVEALEDRQLLSGTPLAIASSITHSTENYTNIVTQAYQRYLNRAPDSNGLAFWVDQMQHGLSDERLAAGFVGSVEYIQDHGGSDAFWVKGMYQNILGRTPAQAEVDYWMNVLASGASTNSVAFGFAASAEHEGQVVTADYQKYLGRLPSASETNYWVNDFLHGASNEDVVAGFVGSPEYYGRMGGNANAADWLVHAYQDVLGRTPSNQECLYWVGVTPDNLPNTKPSTPPSNTAPSTQPTPPSAAAPTYTLQNGIVYQVVGSSRQAVSGLTNVVRVAADGQGRLFALDSGGAVYQLGNGNSTRVGVGLLATDNSIWFLSADSLDAAGDKKIYRVGTLSQTLSPAALSQFAGTLAQSLGAGVVSIANALHDNISGISLNDLANALKQVKGVSLGSVANALYTGISGMTRAAVANAMYYGIGTSSTTLTQLANAISTGIPGSSLTAVANALFYGINSLDKASLASALYTGISGTTRTAVANAMYYGINGQYMSLADLAGAISTGIPGGSLTDVANALFYGINSLNKAQLAGALYTGISGTTRTAVANAMYYGINGQYMSLADLAGAIATGIPGTTLTEVANAMFYGINSLDKPSLANALYTAIPGTSYTAVATAMYNGISSSYLSLGDIVTSLQSLGADASDINVAMRGFLGDIQGVVQIGPQTILYMTEDGKVYLAQSGNTTAWDVNEGYLSLVQFGANQALLLDHDGTFLYLKPGTGANPVWAMNPYDAGIDVPGHKKELFQFGNNQALFLLEDGSLLSLSSAAGSQPVTQATGVQSVVQFGDNEVLYLQNGTLYSWTAGSSPVTVATGVQSLAQFGFGQALYTLQNGTSYSWAADGTPTSQLAGAKSVVQVSSEQVLFLLPNGTLYSWATGGSPIAQATNVQTLASLGGNSCYYVLQNGDVYDWGSGSPVQLGQDATYQTDGSLWFLSNTADSYGNCAIYHIVNGHEDTSFAGYGMTVASFNKWMSLGGPSSSLGSPTSYVNQGNGYTWQPFSNGYLYTVSGNAQPQVYVGLPITDTFTTNFWFSLGGPSGILGAPTNHYGSQGEYWWQEFANGAIYNENVPAGIMTYTITGAAWAAYKAQSESLGPLGLPTSKTHLTPSGAGTITYFQRGAIYSDATGTVWRQGIPQGLFDLSPAQAAQFSPAYLRVRENYLARFFFDGLSADQLSGNQVHFGDQTLYMGQALETFAGEAQLLSRAGLDPSISELIVGQILGAFEQLQSSDGFFVRDNATSAIVQGTSLGFGGSDYNTSTIGDAMSLDQIVGLMQGWWAVTRYSTSAQNRDLARAETSSVMDYLFNNVFIITRNGSPVGRGAFALQAAGYLCEMALAISGQDYTNRVVMTQDVNPDDLVAKATDYVISKIGYPDLASSISDAIRSSSLLGFVSNGIGLTVRDLLNLGTGLPDTVLLDLLNNRITIADVPIASAIDISRWLPQSIHVEFQVPVPGIVGSLLPPSWTTVKFDIGMSDFRFSVDIGNNPMFQDRFQSYVRHMCLSMLAFDPSITQDEIDQAALSSNDPNAALLRSAVQGGTVSDALRARLVTLYNEGQLLQTGPETNSPAGGDWSYDNRWVRCMDSPDTNSTPPKQYNGLDYMSMEVLMRLQGII